MLSRRATKQLRYSLGPAVIDRLCGCDHRNNVRLDARSGTVHGGGEANNGKATNDTDYSNVPGGPTPHTLRKNSSAIRIHLRLPLAGKLGWSARVAPLHDGKCMGTVRSLVRDERHYLMDKKNDHSCKHSIEARAANHWYAFHIPHPDEFPTCCHAELLR